MLKKPVTYTNFNDETVTKVLYFHISKTRLSENLGLADRLNAVDEMLSGPTRQLTREEVSEILDLMKLVLRLSYGVRSADGESFDQSEALWQEFTTTAAYDALLFQLFESESAAVEFMSGILPKDLREGPKDHLSKIETIVEAPALDSGDRAVPDDQPTVEYLEAQLAALRAARHSE